MEILPGVHQFKVPLPEMPLDWVNIYLVRGPRGSLLIDTGWDAPGVFDNLCQQFAADNVKIEDIKQVVVTHVHVDHYGLVARFKQLSGARVLVHPAEESLVEERYVNYDGLLEHMARWLAQNGVPGEELPKLHKVSLAMRKYVLTTQADAAANEGDILSTGSFNLRVLLTPGHSPGHICLYEPEKRLLFSGDHLLPDITTHVGVHPQNTPNPLGDYLASLKKLRDLQVDLILPAHGRTFTGLQQRIDELFRHHEERKQDILGLLDREKRTVYHVATHMTWMKDIGGMPYDRLSYMDKRLAIMETLAHLEVLLQEGKVRRVEEDGLAKYSLAG
ncbi:MAG: MBL fold metallo-hydrolase [Chloroflexota bacterium]